MATQEASIPVARIGPLRAVLDALKALVIPFRRMSSRAFAILVVSQIALAIIFWYHNPWKSIPNPQEIGNGLLIQLRAGLFEHLGKSILTFAQAFVWSTLFSLILGYFSVTNILRPAGWITTKLRFWGLVGLQFIFTVIFGSGGGLKVAIITFGMTVFLTPAVIRIVRNIEQEDYDHARTLRMGDWKVLWYVVIRGTLDKVYDAVQINAAFGFVMLVVVEAIVQSLGGVGALLARRDKYLILDEVFAIQMVILFTGILIDFLLASGRSGLCHYAELTTKARR